jgi:hypothetical protein
MMPPKYTPTFLTASRGSPPRRRVAGCFALARSDTIESTARLDQKRIALDGRKFALLDMLSIPFDHARPAALTAV